MNYEDMTEEQLKNELWATRSNKVSVLNALNTYTDIDHDQMVSLIRDSWNDQELCTEDFLELLETYATDLQDLTSAKLQELLEKIEGDTVTLYRGINSSELSDSPQLSWSLNRDKAFWFANRGSSNQVTVRSMKLSKAELMEKHLMVGSETEEEVVFLTLPATPSDTVFSRHKENQSWRQTFGE